jgi:hypothetical protein
MVVDAAAHKRVRQAFFRVAGNEHEGGVAAQFLPPANALVAQLRDTKEQLIQLVKQVVRKIAGRLVDLIDEDDAARGPIMNKPVGSGKSGATLSRESARSNAQPSALYVM